MKPFTTRILRFSLLISIVFFRQHGISQCNSTVSFLLKNIQGGVFVGENVTLISPEGEKFLTKSGTDGTVNIDVPCDQEYNVLISNYTRKFEIRSPKSSMGRMMRTLTYSPNMKEKDRLFAMSKDQERAVDLFVKRLPDTTRVSVYRRTSFPNNYAKFTLTLKDLKEKSLSREEVTLTGEKRGKTFIGFTDSYGKITVQLPKGDTYKVHFKHHRDYSKQEVLYTKGDAEMRLNLMYMGTEEAERRIRIEKERIAAEERRLEAERKRFKKWCKELGITEEEGHRRKLMENSGGQDSVVLATLNRNDWSEKLIVCDLTGSMNPYANQLSIWYQLNYKMEKNLQFVFFNDGDNKADRDKVIGETGGIYHEPINDFVALQNLMTKVKSNGYGGDCPENNMEALIKGVDQAKPYKELVMIVDNNAPVKDLRLLKNFDRPVHIILCGARDFVLVDYLLIAWKTKGSIHTIERDIDKIASMSEGETIDIQGLTYKIMGGKFVKLDEF
ncbi:MAG: hypothetical protein MK066_07235 [Crocinitomicaceae bacterium]|nr:hypothetical protein [Crocinitomicaceae bacterium]